ncbi:mechanosensitive ion channel [Omnitrophica bacterium]|nr:mechanosensitive ion channel [Candidatus Omnitrophota bacterium]
MEGIWNKISEYIATYGLSILAALIIFIVGKWLARVVSDLIEKGMVRAKTDATLSKFAKDLSYVIFMTFVFIAVLAKLGIQTASFIAVMGAAGLAIGLSLQGSLANFASGVMILLFRPYKVGDFIKAAGTMGTVKGVQIFNTILSSPDNVHIIVPNSQVTGGTITNYSTNSTRRVDLTAGISYGDDIKKAKEILQGILAKDPMVLKEPAPVVAVQELGDSSVNFVVRPWVKSSDYWAAYFGITEKMKLELDRGGITIPFPQRDLHVYSEATQTASNPAQAVSAAR